MLLFGGKTGFIATFFFIATWVFCGGGLLWLGGRFLAKSQKATFWRSCGTNIVAVLCSFLIQIPIRFTSAALHRTLDVQISRLGIGLTLFGVFLGIVISWWIIKISFTISFPKAILAWLPSTGQFIVFIALYLFWPIPQQYQPSKEYATAVPKQATENLYAQEVEDESTAPALQEPFLPSETISVETKDTIDIVENVLNKIREDSTLDEVLEIVGQPSETIVGQPLSLREAKAGVLYKDINGRKGRCYYRPLNQNLMIFFRNYKIDKIQVTRDDFRTKE